MFSWVKQNVQLFCFFVGLLCAAPLIFLTPPFQVPDEPQHFFRAYQISEGNLRAEIQGNAAGAVLPSSLIEFSNRQLGTRAIHVERTIRKQSWSLLATGFDIPLLPARREFIDFSGSAFYSPIPYIPQASAILVGRIFHAGPQTLLYAARFSNMIFALIFISFAAAYSPLTKSGFLFATLLPMTLYLFASLSPDALVISSAFLYIAISLKAYLKNSWNNLDITLALICATVFCSVKIVYAPLILISLPLLLKTANRRREFINQLVLILLPAIITITWLRFVSDLIIPVKNGTNFSMQLNYIISDPFEFSKIVLRSFFQNGFYLFMMIGILGWVNLKLPVISYILPIIPVGVSIFYSANTKFSRHLPILGWWIFLISSTIGLIMLALYLYWTPVAYHVVEGVQGRYFIPILPILFAICAYAFSKNDENLFPYKALVGIGLLGFIEALLTFLWLIRAYWTI